MARGGNEQRRHLLRRRPTCATRPVASPVRGALAEVGVVFSQADRARIDYCEFSADGQQLLVVAPEGLLLFGHENSGLLPSGPLSHLPAGEEPFVMARFCSHGDAIAIAMGNGGLEVVGPGIKHQRLGGHKGPINDLVFRPGSTVFATCVEDSFVQLWSAANGSVPGQTQLPDGRRAYACDFRPTSGMLAIGDDQGTTWLWDSDRPYLSPTIVDRGPPGGVPVWQQLYSPDGALLATVSGEVLQLRDATTLEEQLSLKLNEMRWAAFSPDSSLLAIAAAHDLSLWSVRDGRLLSERSASDWITTLSFHPNGSELVTTDEGGAVRLWSVR